MKKSANQQAEDEVRGDERVVTATVHDDGGNKGVKEVVLRRGFSYDDDGTTRHSIIETTWQQALRRLRTDVVSCGCFDCLGSIKPVSVPAPSGRFGNRNAAKPASKKLLDHLHIPCGIREKREWWKRARAYGGMGKWVRKTLNEAIATENVGAAAQK